MDVLTGVAAEVLNNNVIGQLGSFFAKHKALHYNRRDIILQANKNPTSVFYIKNGYMRAYRISEQGEELTLMILKPNDLFPLSWGDMDIIDNYYLEAITPLDVWKVPYEEFTNFIRTQPQLFYEFTSYAFARLGGLLARIEYLVFGNAYTKVASTLFICARSFGEKKGLDIVLSLPLTHRDIATLAGITRETTCLEMKKLERRGIIAHNGRVLIVKDIEGLEKESSFNSETEHYLTNSL